MEKFSLSKFNFIIGHNENYSALSVMKVYDSLILNVPVVAVYENYYDAKYFHKYCIQLKKIFN